MVRTPNQCLHWDEGSLHLAVDSEDLNNMVKITVGFQRGMGLALLFGIFLCKPTFNCPHGCEETRRKKGLLFASICQKGVNRTYHKTGWARLLKSVMKPASPSSLLPLSSSSFSLTYHIEDFRTSFSSCLHPHSTTPIHCLASPLLVRTLDVNKILCADEELVCDRQAAWPAVSQAAADSALCHVTQALFSGSILEYAFMPLWDCGGYSLGGRGMWRQDEEGSVSIRTDLEQ